MKEHRFEQAERAAWSGIAGNLGLAVMKGIVGFLSGSKALIADAANSAADVAGSVAVLIGIRTAKRPPDEDHPYGHGKAEPIAAIVVSVLMLLVGLEIGINAVKSLYGGVKEAPEWYALLAVAAAIIVKEILFQYNYRVGQKINSQALIANAWDHRTDVFSSVAVLVGVAGALAGEKFNLPYLLYSDSVASLLVAILILRTGYKLITDSIHSTMDHVLHQEDSAELKETVERMPGVIAVNELRAREHGHYVIVDIKISVNPRITVSEGHEIGKRVKHQLMKRFSHVTDVFVHVNPYDPGYPYKGNSSDEDDYPTLLH